MQIYGDFRKSAKDVVLLSCRSYVITSSQAATPHHLFRSQGRSVMRSAKFFVQVSAQRSILFQKG